MTHYILYIGYSMQHVGSIRSRLFPDSDNTGHFKTYGSLQTIDLWSL